MSTVPAICDRCGAVFAAPVPFGVANATFVGCAAGPCPRCGGSGHIPDGAYDFVARTVTALRGSNRSVADLQKLKQLLERAHLARADRTEIERTVRHEAPELASLVDALPKTRQDLYAFLNLLIAALALMIAALQCAGEPKVEVHQVFNYVIQSQQPTDVNQPPPSTADDARGTSKQGRNEPCSCGSGQKYKKCCLQRR